MANPNVFQALIQQPRSALEYGADMDRLDMGRLTLEGQRRQNALSALTEQQTRAQISDTAARRNALQQVYAGLPSDANPITRARALQANPLTADQGVAAEKAALENDKARAATAKDQAEADAKTAETRYTAATRHAQDLAYVQTPQDLVAYIDEGIRLGLKPPESRQATIEKAMQMGVPAFKDAATKGAIPLLEQFKTDAENKRAQLTADTSIRTTKMNNDTSRATNAATQAGEDRRAGVMPDGSISPDMETTAKAIASGQLQPPSGMALVNPKNQRILARVMEINPDYDSTTVTAKKKAASDFTSGTLGNSMRSFAVAGQHLDQLGKLVDGLNNGNLQIVNQIGNAYAAQTGNPAPTNFDAAKDVVSKEVVKAIVAGGGGVAEREELSKLMSSAKSPAQLKGVIQQYRSLMGAQHDALLEQRRAAGLPDSTMPNYEGGGKPAKSKNQEAADAILNGG